MGDVFAEAQQIEQLYANGRDQDLLDLADKVWADNGPDCPGAAEVARFARVAAYKKGAQAATALEEARAKADAAQVEEARERVEHAKAEDDLWQARTIVAASITGTWRTLALSLQQYFHRCIDRREYPAAEAVLEMMEELAQKPHEGLPPEDLTVGILAERRGLLLTELEKWDETAASYQTALDLCPTGERRYLKVSGGLARCKWLAGGDDAAAAQAFEALRDESEAFPDVHEQAVANLDAARAGDRSMSVPFDLVSLGLTGKGSA